MDVPHYWTADQVKRLLDALASHNRHQARTAALIMWRTGLRVSEVLDLEWHDLDYSGDPTTLFGPEVEEPACLYGAAASGSGAAVHELAGEPVAAGQGGVAEHADGDGIEWAGLGEESPGTGQRRAGAHSLRHSAARHWLVAGGIPLNVVSSWLGHANVQVTLRIYLPIVGSDYSMDAVP